MSAMDNQNIHHASDQNSNVSPLSLLMNAVNAHGRSQPPGDTGSTAAFLRTGGDTSRSVGLDTANLNQPAQTPARQQFPPQPPIPQLLGLGTDFLQQNPALAAVLMSQLGQLGQQGQLGQLGQLGPSLGLNADFLGSIFGQARQQPPRQAPVQPMRQSSTQAAVNPAMLAQVAGQNFGLAGSGSIPGAPAVQAQISGSHLETNNPSGGGGGSGNSSISGQGQDFQMLQNIRQQQQQVPPSSNAQPVLSRPTEDQATGPPMGGGHHINPQRQSLVDPSQETTSTTIACANNGMAVGVDRGSVERASDEKKSGRSIVIPCRARGMPVGHNFKTAYFVIPVDKSKHGDELHCSYLACRNAGVKFRYCAYCRVPVAKRNFRKRHMHGDVALKEDSQSCDAINDDMTAQENDERNGIPNHVITKSSSQGKHEPKELKVREDGPQGVKDSGMSRFSSSGSSDHSFGMEKATKEKRKKSSGSKGRSDRMSKRRRVWCELLDSRPPTNHGPAISEWLEQVLAVSDLGTPMVSDSHSESRSRKVHADEGNLALKHGDLKLAPKKTSDGMRKRGSRHEARSSKGLSSSSRRDKPEEDSEGRRGRHDENEKKRPAQEESTSRKDRASREERHRSKSSSRHRKKRSKKLPREEKSSSRSKLDRSEGERSGRETFERRERDKSEVDKSQRREKERSERRAEKERLRKGNRERSDRKRSYGQMYESGDKDRDSSSRKEKGSSSKSLKASDKQKSKKRRIRTDEGDKVRKRKAFESYKEKQESEGSNQDKKLPALPAEEDTGGDGFQEQQGTEPTCSVVEQPAASEENGDNTTPKEDAKEDAKEDTKKEDEDTREDTKKEDGGNELLGRAAEDASEDANQTQPVKEEASSLEPVETGEERAEKEETSPENQAENSVSETDSNIAAASAVPV